MEERQPKPFVFVLMPFEDTFEDVYKVGIRPACIDAGAYCERVDEQIFDESILQRIYNQISKADLIVADMTGRNPNVFYEVGYAHALGKRVILITQKVEDIPFDLKHYPHIIYGGKIAELKTQLENRVRWYVTQAIDPPLRLNTGLQFFMDGISLEGDSVFEYNIADEPYVTDLAFTIDIHNPLAKICQKGDFNLCLLTSNRFPQSEQTERIIRQPDGTYLHQFKSLDSIFPGGWTSIKFRLLTIDKNRYHSDNDEELRKGETLEFILRVFTSSGIIDFPFKTKLKGV